MDSKQIEDWLDKYFNEELSEDEKIEFEKLLSTSDELKKSFELEEKIIQGIRANKKKELREIIHKEHIHFKNTNQTKSKTMKTKKFPLFAVAATLALLIIAIAVVKPFEQTTPYDNKGYLASVKTFQKKNLAKFSSRGGTDNIPTLNDTLNQGLDLSIQGKYKEAKQLFLAASKTHPNNEFVQLQLALQDFYVGNYANTFPRLDKIVNSKNVDIREEAEMLYAQAAFKLGDQMTTAKKWMQKISNQKNHRYVKEAAGMLSLID